MERERSPLAPSRRSLAALIGAGAIMALPIVPALAVAGSPDVELIAFAEHVVRLTERAERAWARRSRREDAAGQASPAWPMRASLVPYEREPRREDPASALRKLLADELASGADDEPWIISMRTRIARMEAHEAECARWQRHFRVEESAAIARRADERMEAAALQLASMRASTIAGAAAKVRAVLASEALSFREEWAEDLALSVLHDVLAIGSAA